MRGEDHAGRVTPSLLDRLIDLNPGVPDTAPSRSQSVRELRDAVRRDLEHLLNTRNALYDLPSAFVEVSRSVVAYGIPDLTSLNIASVRSDAGSHNRNRLRQIIETAIRGFEPRLSTVAVTLRDSERSDGALSLHIDARLMIDPSPEPIAFDILVPMNTRQCQVKGTD